MVLVRFIPITEHDEKRENKLAPLKKKIANNIYKYIKANMLNCGMYVPMY